MVEEDNLNKNKSEIEETDESKEERANEPFDPTKIDITTKSLNIDLLVKRLKSKPSRINLSTDFQRRNDLWTPEKQSRLIESMMIRLPLPVFYFDASNENSWEVVDGLQRLSTLNNFIVKKDVKLRGLEYLVEYNDKYFDELPEYMKTRIEETEVTVYLINPGTPLNVKYNIFKRINTSGLVLTPQEIRHAVNQGIPSNFVKELAELPEFISATDKAIKPTRMDDRDFVTRFIAFYLKSYINYKPDLDTFLTQEMANLADISLLERNNIKSDFIKSMKAAKAIFNNDAFRKRYYRSDPRSLINKALFDTWSVNLSRTSDHGVNLLIERSEIVKDKFIKLMHERDFDASVSRSTGSPGAIQVRFEAINKLINEVLHAY